MKIAAVNRQAVQPGYKDSGARAASINQMSQSLAGAASSLSASAEKMLKIKTDRQIQQAELYMQKSDNEFWGSVGGKDFFDVEDIDPKYRTPGMEVKGRVLSAEVVPQIYEDFIGTQLDSAAKIIDNEKLRQDWTVSAKDTATQRQTRIQTEANASIEKQIFRDQIVNFENAMDDDRPDVALQITKGMKGPPEDIERYRDVARKGAETTTYEAKMIDEDYHGMGRAIGYLQQDPPKYREDGGQLNREERLAWISKLRRERDRIESKNSAYLKSQLNLLKRQLRITESNSLKGKFTDDVELVELRNKAVMLNSDGSLSDDIADLDASILYTRLTNDLINLDGPDRKAFLAAVDGLDIPDFEKDQLMLRLEQAESSFSNTIQTDMMKAASESGFVELSPINTQVDLRSSGAMEEMIKSFSNRVIQYHEAEAHYGDGQGMLTNEEASAISTQVNNLSAKGKQQFLVSVATSLGPDATKFYQQLDIDGSSSTLSVAGMATLNGHRSISEIMLIGNEYSRLNPDEMKVLNKLMAIKLDKALGQSFRGNPAYRASIKEAATDAYIGLVLENGVGFTKIYSKLLSRAVDGATGGLVKQNGEMIPPPVYGMTQNEWKVWTRTLHPNTIKSLGGIDGMTDIEVTDKIHDGDIHILGTGQHGKYVLARPNGVPFAKKDGGVFILDYDANAPRVRRALVPVGTSSRPTRYRIQDQDALDKIEERRAAREESRNVRKRAELE